MEPLKLEPPNENTIFCDIKLLREIEAFILDLSYDDIESAIVDLESGEDLEYYDLPFDLEEIDSVKSELIPSLKQFCEHYKQVDKMLSERSEYWEDIILDPQSGFNEGYSYVANESSIDLDRLRRYIEDHVADNYPEDITDLDQIAEKVSDILADKDIEIYTESGRYHNEPLFDLACMPWTKYEDQIGAGMLLDIVEGLTIESLKTILEKLSDDYCIRYIDDLSMSGDPYFYQIHCIDAYVYYGYSFEALDQAIASVITGEDTE